MRRWERFRSDCLRWSARLPGFATEEHQIILMLVKRPTFNMARFRTVFMHTYNAIRHIVLHAINSLDIALGATFRQELVALPLSRFFHQDMAEAIQEFLIRLIKNSWIIILALPIRFSPRPTRLWADVACFKQLQHDTNLWHKFAVWAAKNAFKRCRPDDLSSRSLEV